MTCIKHDVYDKLILPQDSKEFLRRMNCIPDINLHLSQNRYCYEKMTNSGKKYSTLILAEISKRSLDYTEIYEKEAPVLIERLNYRNQKIVETFQCHKFYRLDIYDKLMIGESSVYHGMQPLRLHPLYGIPYIPASVIKGTLRSVWIMERYGGDTEKAESDDGFIELFGGKRKDGKRFEGRLSFFDTYPERFSIGVDVQTIHYRYYYDKPNKRPTDDQSTLPVFFGCLRKAAFQVGIASNDEAVWKPRQKELDAMVKCMFTQYGIGAKTALGYGTGSLS